MDLPRKEFIMKILNYVGALAPVASLMLSGIAAVPAPALAQAQTPITTGGQVCQTFNSNAMPYGYVGVANVDLGSVFSTIDTISGTISGNRSNGPATVALPKITPNGMWGNQGYFVPAWGSTGGWKSYIGYLGGTYPGTATSMLDVIDIRFGTDDGIHPGKAIVPQGVQGLYVVQRNEHGHSPLRLEIKNFNLTICGKATQSAQQCQTIPLTQTPRILANGPAMLTLPGTPKKLISATGTVNVAAYGNKPAQTASLGQGGFNQPQTPSMSSLGSKVLLFMVPDTYAGPWNAQAGRPYVNMNAAVTPGYHVAPVISWANGATTSEPPHGAITGTVTLCVQ
jgi:hypothetical protein